MKHTKQTAGSIGGKATLERHGRSHMQTIGRKGAAVTWTRYQLSPVGLTEYAMVERATGKIVRIIAR
jgi:general stress protein YciG